MEEIIDYFDENTGKIIGCIEKEIAHKKGLWHKSVHVWIINDNNQILLQQRCKEKSLYPNVWDVSFAGHLTSGEDSFTAIIREGMEEFGIKIDTNKIEYLFTNKEKLVYEQIQSNEFVDIYLLRQNVKLEDITFQESEVSDVKYIEIDDFFDMVVSKSEDLFPHINEYEKLRLYL